MDLHIERWVARLLAAWDAQDVERVTDGTDLAPVRGERLARNEVRFDRAVRAPLLGD